MSPETIALISQVLQLGSEIISSRIKQHDELLTIFNLATEENRDLTDEEVSLFKERAEFALKEMQLLNPLID